jgi:hypothetical protein
MFRLVLAVCLASLTGCADRESYTDRVEGIPLLLGAFQSYSSEREVRANLASQPVQDVERSSLAPGDKRPPYNIVTLAVVEYRHLGVPGELRLFFFNDRLMNVWFYPTDVDAYMAALRSRDVAVAADRADRGSTARRIWSQRDSRDRVYVGWSDGRLEDQSARWISRYS